MYQIRRFIVLLMVSLMAFAGTAHGATGDGDGDGVPDNVDNCPSVYNPGQADFNHDGIGDACQDTDKDGLTDEYELNTVYGGARHTSPTNRDTDGDGLGDGSEVQRTYGPSNAPRHTDPTLVDTDHDGWEDGTEVYVGTDPTNPDTDGDGIKDPTDNCPKASNPDQKDSDHNGKGDACDPPPPPPCDASCQAQQQAGQAAQQAEAAAGQAAGAAESAASAVVDQLSGPVDVRPYGDLNKMATDGYVLQIVQSDPTYFEVQVLNASTGAPVALNLPDLKGKYSVNGPVGVFVVQPNLVSPVSGSTVDLTTASRLNVKWRYASKRKALVVRTLDHNITQSNVALTFAVQPVGYPQQCVGTPFPKAPNTCDGYALGFYNPLKATTPQDTLDAVPYPTTVN
jgi:hypothetical protein